LNGQHTLQGQKKHRFAPHKGLLMRGNMNLRSPRLILMALAALLIIIISACAPEATPPAVDTVGTLAQAMAYDMQTQTASAPSPTPLPATATLTPSSTDTPTLEPTKSGPVKRPVIKAFTGCYYGPGPDYKLDSNIAEGKKVEIVGIGSVPGWYVIINPYFHKQCWVEAAQLEIDPAMDLTSLPVMTPIP